MKQLLELIEKQQKGKEDTPVWMVGEQLKEIAQREPATVELLKQDLEIPEMSLEKAETQIKKYSDEHRQSKNSFCVSPKVAEGILRKFYALPDLGDASSITHTAPSGGYIDLDSFL